MGRPYSLDLRERVVTAMAAGLSGREAAARHFSIGESTALRWARRARETGSAKAKPMGGTRPFALEAHRHWITARLVEKPDLTLRALGYTSLFDLPVGLCVVGRECGRLPNFPV
jgi:transposase